MEASQFIKYTSPSLSSSRLPRHCAAISNCFSISSLPLMVLSQQQQQHFVYYRRGPRNYRLVKQMSRELPAAPGLDNPFGRRQMAAMHLSLVFLLAIGSDSDAEAIDLPTGLKKYIKRKKLDPLDTYVAPVLLSQLQLQELELELLSENLEYADARSLLRSGPTASLRIDIRAVAQYALESGNDQGAFDAVDHCLRALEDLDSLLLRASRGNSSATVKSMKDKINLAVVALDRILATVPTAILERSKSIAASHKNPPTTEQYDDLDTKILESLL